MTLPPYSAPPSLIEQTHLASMRGKYKEARLMLEALIDAEPNNVAAQDLLAQVALKQGSMVAGQIPKPPWRCWSMPNKAASNLVVGLVFLGIGIVQTVPIFQAGFAHGFGLQTTITIEGKNGHSFQVTMGSQAAHCCIPIGIGLVLLYLFFRQVSDRNP